MVEPRLGERTREFSRAALWAAALGVMGYHAALALETLRLTEPMGMWETAYASVARNWPDQYQWGHFVLGHDNYGPGYPAFCRPFLWLVGDVYVASRLANLVCLAAACFLLASLLRAVRCPRYATCGLVAVLFGLNAGSYSLQARPDFLVLFLILAALGVGQQVVLGRIRPGAAGLLLGALTLAGYLTKPYALFGWGGAVAGILVLRGPRAALAVGGTGGLLCAAGVALFARFNPLYVLETFDANLAHMSLDLGWLVHQSSDFGILAFWPLLGSLAAVVLLARSDPTNPGEPEASQAARPFTTYWALVAALALALLGLRLGWHTGAYLTYFMHLALAPLCLCSASVFLPRSAKPVPLAAQLALLVNLSVILFQAPKLPLPDPAWDSLRGDILRQKGPVVLDFLMEPLSRERPGAILADTGIVRFAMDEAGTITRPTPALVRARQEVAAFAREETAAFGDLGAATLYLQCTEAPVEGGAATLRLQNGLPWFAGDFLKGYTSIRTFRIHPYYFETNGRRASAGRWEVLVVKFVRKAEPAGPR